MVTKVSIEYKLISGVNIFTKLVLYKSETYLERLIGKYDVNTEIFGSWLKKRCRVTSSLIADW